MYFPLAHKILHDLLQRTLSLSRTRSRALHAQAWSPCFVLILLFAYLYVSVRKTITLYLRICYFLLATCQWLILSFPWISTSLEYLGSHYFSLALYAKLLQKIYWLRISSSMRENREGLSLSNDDGVDVLFSMTTNSSVWRLRWAEKSWENARSCGAQQVKSNLFSQRRKMKIAHVLYYQAKTNRKQVWQGRSSLFYSLEKDVRSSKVGSLDVRSQSPLKRLCHLTIKVMNTKPVCIYCITT
jgi:hypothetical protein